MRVREIESERERVRERGRERRREKKGETERWSRGRRKKVRVR